MLSEFGKFSRKLRFKKSELLIDMAQKLNVTPSFLSAVEVGKKSIPDKWEHQIIELYELNEIEALELKEAISNSIRQLKIDLSQRKLEDRDLLLSFARKLDTLDTKDKESILNILNKKK